MKNASLVLPDTLSRKTHLRLQADCRSPSMPASRLLKEPCTTVFWQPQKATCCKATWQMSVIIACGFWTGRPSDCSNNGWIALYKEWENHLAGESATLFPLFLQHTHIYSELLWGGKHALPMVSIKIDCGGNTMAGAGVWRCCREAFIRVWALPARLHSEVLICVGRKQRKSRLSSLVSLVPVALIQQ